MGSSSVGWDPFSIIKHKQKRRCDRMEKRIDWGKLVEGAINGSSGRSQSGLRKHIVEVLDEVPEAAREKLQGQSIGVWAQVLRAVLVEKYPEHKGDNNLYNKIRVNISSWKKRFEYDKETKSVKYLNW